MKFLITILLTLSCTRTVFDKAETDNMKNTRNLSKIAVFALVNDSKTFTSWENAVAEALREDDINAEAGFKYVPGERSQVKPELAAKDLRKRGFDTVIIIELVDIRRDRLSSGTRNPEIQDAESMGHFTTHFSRASGTQRVVKDKTQKSIVTLKTTIYSLKKNFPVVWSAKSSTYNPYDEDSTRKSYAGVLAGKLKKTGLFNK